MRGFERASTETRKMVKEEERLVYFLDDRKMNIWKTQWFMYSYSKKCKNCDLYFICAWVWQRKRFYNYV